MRQPNHLVLGQNFEFRAGAIDGLQICNLKPSELGTIHIFHVLCVSV